jgi:hydroxymethylbilane synthase
MNVTIGTRGSALALRQTELVVSALRERHPSVRFAVKTIQTGGDRNQRDRISQIGDKGVFVRPIESALLSGEIDVAVHSLKDVPSDVQPDGLVIAAFSPREDARDVLIARHGATLDHLAPGSQVGTGSLRRRAQLNEVRPDLAVLDIRGNVDTRLRKLDAGEYDAIVLAAAGVRRLGLEARVSQYLSVTRFVPDAGQGIIAIQTRAGDDSAALISSIDDADSRAAALAERAVVQALGADCRSPVGAYADPTDGGGVLIGMAAPEDCSFVVRERVDMMASDPGAAGHRLGLSLRRALDASSVY